MTGEFLIHGGDLASASRHYGIARSHWLDLSTGINPLHYPIDNIDVAAFTRLPYPDQDLLQAACEYYRVRRCLAVAGSQAVIARLPALLPRLPVLLPDLGYQEHHASWRRAGNPRRYYPAWQHQQAVAAIEQQLADNRACHLLCINPNNPTGMMFTPQQLLDWAARLVEGGCLIVDEAFIDLTPSSSVLSEHLPDNVLVLRSFGKFFGLPGLRLGFVMACDALLDALALQGGLWAVNGPAQCIARHALRDVAWQQQARHDIQVMADFTDRLSAPMWQGTDVRGKADGGLFFSYRLPRLQALQRFEHCARHAVLLRYLPLDNEDALLRIGLVAVHDSRTDRLGRLFASYKKC